MISVDTEKGLWICEGSRHSVPMVSKSREKELGRLSVVRLVKMPPYSVVDVSGYMLKAGPAQSAKNTEGMSTVAAVG